MLIVMYPFNFQIYEYNIFYYRESIDTDLF